MIELRKHPLGWAVYYAGTILFIGAKGEAQRIAERCAAAWRVAVRR